MKTENKEEERLHLDYWWHSVSNMVVVMVRLRCLSKHLAKEINGSYIKSTWLCIRTRFFLQFVQHRGAIVSQVTMQCYSLKVDC